MSETIEQALEYALKTKKTAVSQCFESGLIDDLEHLVWHGVVPHPDIQELPKAQMSNRTYGFMYNDLLFSFGHRERDIKRTASQRKEANDVRRYECGLFVGESKVLATAYNEVRRTTPDDTLWTTIEFSDDPDDFTTVILGGDWLTSFQEAMSLMREVKLKLDRAKEIAKTKLLVEQLELNFQSLDN